MRPVDAIVSAAAAAVDAEQESASVTEALLRGGVRWGWQLEHADSDDWANFGASIGLKMAIRAELQNPNSMITTSPEKQHQIEILADKRLRNFLLLPGPDGEPPRRLNTINSMFMSLLLVSAADRQNLVIVFCEMLALVSGLMMPLPLVLLMSPSESHPEKVWDAPPPLVDCMDATAVACTSSLGYLSWARSNPPLLSMPLLLSDALTLDSLVRKPGGLPLGRLRLHSRLRWLACWAAVL